MKKVSISCISSSSASAAKRLVVHGPDLHGHEVKHASMHLAFNRRDQKSMAQYNHTSFPNCLGYQEKDEESSEMNRFVSLVPGLLKSNGSTLACLGQHAMLWRTQKKPGAVVSMPCHPGVLAGHGRNVHSPSSLFPGS